MPRTTATAAGVKQRLLAAGILLLIAVAGWATPAVAAGLTIVVTHKVLGLHLYVADSQGFFAAEGVQVALKETSDSKSAMQQLLDGKADLVTAADSVVMFQSFERADFAVIATIATSDTAIKLIVGNAHGTGQLAGKRIGMVIGTAGEYYVDSWLIFHGVDPKTTRPVSLRPEAMAGALANGAVDAVAIWDPFGFEILKTVAGARLLPNPNTYKLSFNLVAHRKLLGPRDEELTRVLRALLRAEQFILAEPAKTQAILRERLKLGQDFIDEIWLNNRHRLSLEQSLLTTLESEARWARREGHVTADRSPNYLGLIHAEPLRKASPDRVGIGR
jgi:NitT/TauT family transport system substrate-binding protein